MANKQYSEKALEFIRNERRILESKKVSATRSTKLFYTDRACQTEKSVIPVLKLLANQADELISDIQKADSAAMLRNSKNRQESIQNMVQFVTQNIKPLLAMGNQRQEVIYAAARRELANLIPVQWQHHHNATVKQLRGMQEHHEKRMQDLENMIKQSRKLMVEKQQEIEKYNSIWAKMESAARKAGIDLEVFAD
jgi:hypothetical protein